MLGIRSLRETLLAPITLQLAGTALAYATPQVRFFDSQYRNRVMLDCKLKWESKTLSILPFLLSVGQN